MSGRKGQTCAESLVGGCLGLGGLCPKPEADPGRHRSRSLPSGHSSRMTGKFSLLKGNAGSASVATEEGRAQRHPHLGDSVSPLAAQHALPLTAPGVLCFSPPAAREARRHPQRHEHSVDPQAAPSSAASG